MFLFRWVQLGYYVVQEETSEWIWHGFTLGSTKVISFNLELDFLFTVGKEKVMKTFSNEYESTAACKAKAAKACWLFRDFNKIKKKRQANCWRQTAFTAAVHCHKSAHAFIVRTPYNETNLSGCDELLEEHLLERSRMRRDPETLVCVNGLSLPWTNAGRQMSQAEEVGRD